MGAPKIRKRAFGLDTGSVEVPKADFLRWIAEMPDDWIAEAMLALNERYERRGAPPNDEAPRIVVPELT